jgi:hypothetical protein
LAKADFPFLIHTAGHEESSPTNPETGEFGHTH